MLVFIFFFLVFQIGFFVLSYTFSLKTMVQNYFTKTKSYTGQNY